MSLQSTFCESLLFIALGQTYRLALLNRPGRRHFITLLVKMCLQVTLPCTLIRFGGLPPSANQSRHEKQASKKASRACTGQ